MKCGHTWAGLSACHCARCHETFTGVEAFDLHQAWSYGGGESQAVCVCRDPNYATGSKGRQMFAAAPATGYWQRARYGRKPYP